MLTVMDKSFLVLFYKKEHSCLSLYSLYINGLLFWPPTWAVTFFSKKKSCLPCVRRYPPLASNACLLGRGTGRPFRRGRLCLCLPRSLLNCRRCARGYQPQVKDHPG